MDFFWFEVNVKYKSEVRVALIKAERRFLMMFSFLGFAYV